MTAQIKERLYIDDIEYGIATEPLQPYINNLNYKLKFLIDTTACWRGYIGEWQLIEDKLFLKAINGIIYNEIDEAEVVDINYLFPNQDKVFANWYTGIIRVPDGNIIKHVHGGYLTQHERDLFLKFKKGNLIDFDYKDNSLEKPIRETFLKRLLEKFKSIF